MKKDDLLTHLSFFGVLMTMAVLPAPVDAGTMNLALTESDSITGYMSDQAFSYTGRAERYEIVRDDTLSSIADMGRHSLVLNGF